MQSPLRSSSSGGGGGSSSDEGIMTMPTSPQHMTRNGNPAIGGPVDAEDEESEGQSSLMVPLVAVAVAAGGDRDPEAPPSWLLRSRKLSKERPNMPSSTATDKQVVPSSANANHHACTTKPRRGLVSLGWFQRMFHMCGPNHTTSNNSGSKFNCNCKCKYPRNIVQSTLSLMHFLGRLLMWGSVAATAAGVVWYSRELSVNGTDPHLIAWFSAGAFVLLGFPISMYGIFMHLSNYYQPNVQCYVVRILWMVPLYSIESWLCLRFHKYAIYIETLRDCYESYVLYSFLRFLIEVLGGEEALVLMLKDKSPTRGVHMWGFEWCIKPWLMGQPMSRTIYIPTTTTPTTTGSSTTTATANMGNDPTPGVIVLAAPGAKNSNAGGPMSTKTVTTRPVKRVQWTSPFFVRCKLGVLQYVLLKVVLSIFTMILEKHDLYKEGNFTHKGGYLYICILTNLSQCWALYCLIFFYYATKNELGPIRPVGKFLTVKAIVFFTWWQSVGISILYQMGMIPHYASNEVDEWSSEDVAKGLQDYLICIEMFIGAIVHTFVFPHTDYLTPLDHNNRNRPPRRHSNHAHNSNSSNNTTNDGTARHFGGQSPDRNSREGRRLGRKGRAWNAALSHQYQRVSAAGNNIHTDDKSHASKNSNTPEYDLELGPSGAVMVSGTTTTSPFPSVDSELALVPLAEQHEHVNDETDHRMLRSSHAESSNHASSGTHSGVDPNHYHPYAPQPSPSLQQQQQPPRPTAGFVRALLDSSIPSDVVGHTMGMVKGDFAIEKKTLLFHAATSDEYDLFSKYHHSRGSRLIATPAATASTTNNNNHVTTDGAATTRSTVAASSSMPTSTPLLAASSTHKQPPTKTPKEQH